MMHSRGQLIKHIAYEWLTDSYNQTKQYTVEYQIILTMMHFSADRREGSWNELELLNSINFALLFPGSDVTRFLNKVGILRQVWENMTKICTCRSRQKAIRIFTSTAAPNVRPEKCYDMSGKKMLLFSVIHVLPDYNLSDRGRKCEQENRKRGTTNTTYEAQEIRDVTNTTVHHLG
jgi:hypothetical protein